MEVNERFERFLIKKLVKGISYDADVKKFKTTTPSLTDSLLSELQEEGVHYGLSARQVKDEISRLSRNIHFNPSRVLINRNIDPKEIVVGQHLAIYAFDPVYGKSALQLLCLETNRFLVVGSDRNVLLPGDVLTPLSQPWNLSFAIDFQVVRNNKPYPDADHWYRTRQVYYFEYLNPSPVYEVYDSECDFTYKKSRKSQKKDMVTTGTVYRGWPAGLNPVTFLLEDNVVDATAPFEISILDEKTAALGFNAGCENFYCDTDSFIEQFHAVIHPSFFKKPVVRPVSLKTYKKGLLEKQEGSSGEPEKWILKEPIVLHTYQNHEK